MSIWLNDFPEDACRRELEPNMPASGSCWRQVNIPRRARTSASGIRVFSPAKTRLPTVSNCSSGSGRGFLQGHLKHFAQADSGTERYPSQPAGRRFSKCVSDSSRLCEPPCSMLAQSIAAAANLPQQLPYMSTRVMRHDCRIVLASHCSSHRCRMRCPWTNGSVIAGQGISAGRTQPTTQDAQQHECRMYD